MEISEFVGGESKYNSDTYIGYLKMKNGGMKIVPGHDDVKIINKRDQILNHLEKVLTGEKRLKEKNIKKYFKALGGKYIRNDMCISGDSTNCNSGQKVSIGGAHKLLKLAKKKDMNMDDILNIFKGSAPVLYSKFDDNIKGGKYKSDDYVLFGGNLREEILQIQLD